MVFIQGVSLASHAYLLVAVAFRTLDGSWEEQSFIAGRGKFATLRLVTVPMLRPALLAAALFFTVVAIESFDIPVTLGMTSHINVISTQIYWVTHPEGGQLPEYGRASALAVWLVLLALVLIHFYHRRTRDVKRFVTITGRGYRPRRLPLGKWRLTICLLAFAFVVVTVALPVFVLVWRSLLRFYVAPSFAALNILNLDAYRRIFNDSDFPPVLWNTVCVALGAAVLCTVIAAGVAWQVVRGQVSPQWRRRLHTLAFFPQAFPSVVIGLSLVFLYLWLPIPIYGTLWIIGLAMVTKYLAYASGSIIAAQMQLSTELEEASRIAGASIGRTYFKIVCPLMMPALLASALWILIHVVRELGLSLMLYSLQSQVLSTKIWLLWENGRVADACATGVLTVVALLCLLSIPGAVRFIRELRKHRVATDDMLRAP
jgi:iron(III) transport system permease protein